MPRPLSDVVCSCRKIERLLLVHLLTDNPVRCYRCKGQVDAERIALTDKQIELVAGWNQQFGSLYRLWLDSGEYERDSKEKLLDKNGQANIEGMALARSLSAKRPVYYWWFWDEEDPAPKDCPACGKTLNTETAHGHGQCDECRIVV